MSSPTVAQAAYVASPATYNDVVSLASRDDRTTFAARASRDSARRIAHLKAVKAEKLRVARKHAAGEAERKRVARKHAAGEAYRARVAKQRAAAAAAQAAAARKAAAVSYTRAVSSGSPRAIGQALAAKRGWTGAQWAALDNLWTAESGWGVTSGNSSGAYGIPQALPGSKMASVGSDWRTNATTQITWGLNYIAGRWGTPSAAWAHFQANHWY